jgi:uncharacterized protein YabE (DUF348 family)
MGRFFLQHIRRVLPLKQMLLLFILSVIAIYAGTQAYATANREIVILDESGTIDAKTLGNDVQQALTQLDVKIGPQDYASLKLDAPLEKEVVNQLEIRRAVPLTLAVDGRKLEIQSWRDNLAEVLNDYSVKIGSLDKLVGAPLEAPVTAGMSVKIIRVRQESISEYDSIPYDVLEQKDKKLNEGETKVTQVGVDGRLESVFQIVYEDGKPVSRTFLAEHVLSEPINRIVALGTVKNFQSSRGELVRYSKILDLKATAYTASLHDTGKSPGEPGFGITKSGIRAREGVIAVDPRIIPLGTKVYVEVPGAAPDYGFAIAADIGSAIKGKLIDLYFGSTEQAIHWGRKSVRIYILNEQNDTRWKKNVNPCKK